MPIVKRNLTMDFRWQWPKLWQTCHSGGVVDSGRWCACVGKGYLWLFYTFCFYLFLCVCECKTTLKNKTYLKNKNILEAWVYHHVYYHLNYWSISVTASQLNLLYMLMRRTQAKIHVLWVCTLIYSEFF